MFEDSNIGLDCEQLQIKMSWSDFLLQLVNVYEAVKVTKETRGHNVTLLN